LSVFERIHRVGRQPLAPYLSGQRAAALTLRDAGSYITKLPKAEHDAPAWRAAIEALMLVAEHGGLTMMARIGVMWALHRHDEPGAPTARKKRARK
jgi:hypothetical protein